MTATYELIDEIKAGSEKTHESMVDVAARTRECERDLKRLEGEALALPEETLKRQKLEFLIQELRISLKEYRFILGIQRTTLDTDKAFLKHLEGDE